MFSIKTTYNISSSLLHDEKHDLWKRVWNLNIPNKMRSFLWLVIHKKIMCNAERSYRGFTTVADCSKCSGELEDVNHIFWSCTVAKQIWISLLSNQEILKHNSMTFEEWIDHNLRNKPMGIIDADWNVTFSVTIWWI